MLLEIKNLSVEFPADPKPLPAVRDVGFGLAPGEVLGLVGESGSGKSVTSLAIMRLLPPQATIGGQIRFAANGSAPVNLLSLPTDQMRSLRGSGISMIFQEPMTALNPVMRVGEQVAEAVRAHSDLSKKAAWDRAVHALREVAIPDPERRANDYPHQLSGGMRKRVSLAQTFINEPEILLMDEPFSALDVQTRTVMHEELLKLWAERKASVVFVTHDLEEAVALADKVYVLTAGPATVKSVYTIDLPRPRVVSEIRYEQSFIDYCKTIWEDLREEVETSYRRASEAA